MKKSLRTILLLLFTIVSGIAHSQMNGVYHIGPGESFQTFGEAITAIESSGLSGPVTFLFANGSYNEYVVIDSVPGSSSVNTLHISSISGNKNNILLTNLTVINGADNIRFSHITFQRINSQDRVIVRNHSENVSFENCGFINAGPANIVGISLQAFDDVNMLNISDNVFDGDMNQLSLTANGIVIRNNSFDGGFYAGIGNPVLARLSNCADITIEKNIFRAGGVLTGNSIGLTIQNCRNFIVSKNKLRGADALSILDSRNSGNGIIIVNNFIVGAVGIIRSDNIKFVFNSIYGSAFVSDNILLHCVNNIVFTPQNTTVMNMFSLPHFSDYNNYFCSLNQNLIYFNNRIYNSLAEFYDSTGLEQSSVSVPVSFVSDFDLHLTGSSLTDQSLLGIPYANVLDDIDGNIRNPTQPFKGADEPSDRPLPVELISFSAAINQNLVRLSWETSGELNNRGFEIEMASVSNNDLPVFKKIGFVQGNNNFNNLFTYEFEYRISNSGDYKFRLKQFDFNGQYTFYNLENLVKIGSPHNSKLIRNYPNPFNPRTRIEYELSVPGVTQLILFDIQGREVIRLINEYQTSGYYFREIDGSNLPSGSYFLNLLVDGRLVDKKKIMLLK
jgi:hypothetical protein